MPNAIAITASYSFFFFLPLLPLPSSFLFSFKAPLGSLFRNYNRSGFRQFDQMQGPHVRIGEGEEGAVRTAGRALGGIGMKLPIQWLKRRTAAANRGHKMRIIRF